MKLQYKAAIIMTLFGAITVSLLSYWFERQNYSIGINNELHNIQNISKEISLHLNSHLGEKISLARTITTAPCIKEALLESNNKFSSLNNKQRDQQITNLDQRWRKAKSSSDPFIQEYMQNSVAKYLQNQQIYFPGEYGEIFLTNRYGALVSTTGKLTTLAHAHKYWWIASYNDGKGRIFLDDRGFDESVEGYVLGVVIPIIDGDAIIGILKCNVNVASSLTNPIEKYHQSNYGDMKIVRTGGLVVRELGALPLSTQVPKSFNSELQKKRITASIIPEKERNILVAMAPVQITLGSSEAGFGGKKQSIDHIKGNTGESWHIVISLPEEKVLNNIHQTTLKIVLVGVIFFIFTSIVAWFLGKTIAKPLVKLAHDAKQIGRGHLHTRAKMSANDEVGSLAKSINNMAINLEKAEAEKEITINNLEKALNEIKTLHGIIPICSYCKKIRNDTGAWDIIEAYISEHSDAEFSHGICPECYKTQMEDVD